MPPIVTLTLNPSLDVSTEVETLFSDRKMRTAELHREPAGGGINVARAIHRLGGEVTALFTSGGPTGAMIQGLLKEAGVAHEPIPIEGISRESFLVWEKSSHKLFHFVSPGPRLRAEEWQSCLEKLESGEPAPSYLVASGSLPPGVPPDGFARVARLAKKRGIRLILDTSGEPLRLALEEGVYLVRPNQREFEELAGKLPESLEEQAALLRDFVEQGKAEVFILALGKEAVLLSSRDLQLLARPPEVDVVSRVGAGDSFVALLAFSLARGRSLEEAFLYGVAAAAAAHLTPSTELFRVDDLERLYRQLRQETPGAFGKNP